MCHTECCLQLGEWISSAPAPFQQIASLTQPSPVITGTVLSPTAGGMMASIPGLPPGTFIPVLQPPPSMVLPPGFTMTGF